MAQAIKMPKLSDDMQEGTLVKWFKNVGDMVEEGEILVEIETDKANMEVECFYPGTLAAQSVAEGETVPIGTVIAMIAESEEEFESLVNEAAKQAAANIEEVKTGGGDDVEEDEEVGADQNGSDGHHQLHVVEEIGGPRKATPVARRIAEEHGVSLVEIQGTGPRGRILKDDVEKHIQAGKPKAAVPIPAQVLPLDQKRKYIVRKMVESKTTIPHYYLGADVKVDEMLKLRKEYNTAKETNVTITDFIVKASAIALETYPLVNAHFDEDVIKYKEHINIAIAVDTGEILMAPVVKNCESKPLSVLSTETRELVDKARAKKLMPEDYEGGTFYISNIGGFGIDEIAPIIFPTTSAILGVGAIAKKVVVEGDEFVIGQVMKIILSADHRVLDGARGAEFLKQVKDNLENPLILFA